MQRYELEAWLGPTLEELTPEKVEELAIVADELEVRYPGKDDSEDREAALYAAVQYTLGELTTTETGETLLRARIAWRRALVVSRQVALMAIRDGAAEATTARETGLDRMDVRKLLGKR
jgi:hypothetical protein